MAFGIIGYGAQQIYPAPALFQALSLGNAPPQPPNPPYGNPNPNLVDVQQTGNPAVPANLTLAAHATFDAILKVNGGTNVVAFGHPSVQPVENTTNAVGATNPSVATQVQGPTPVGLSASELPAGPVSFTLTVAPANLTSGPDALLQTLAQLKVPSSTVPSSNASTNSASTSGASTNSAFGSGAAPGLAATPGTPSASGTSAPSAPAAHSSVGSIPAVATPSFVGRIVQAVQTLAIAAIYPSPIFSFSA